MVYTHVKSFTIVKNRKCCRTTYYVLSEYMWTPAIKYNFSVVAPCFVSLWQTVNGVDGKYFQLFYYILSHPCESLQFNCRNKLCPSLHNTCRKVFISLQGFKCAVIKHNNMFFCSSFSVFYFILSYHTRASLRGHLCPLGTGNNTCWHFLAVLH